MASSMASSTHPAHATPGGGDDSPGGSSSGSSPDLFPAAGASPEPHDASASTAGASGGAPANPSPPPSQDRPADAAAPLPTGDDAMSVDPPETAAAASQGAPSGRRGRAAVPAMAVAEGEPGHSWLNDRAQEEMRRSREAVLDRNFSLREFGDLYDERT